jgi:hypothetical protein
MMCQRRLLGVLLTTAFCSFAVAGAAQEKARKQKPQQVVPTGAEDAPATAARAGAAAAPQTEQLLEQQLERMTDRSDKGLVVVQGKNGTEMVDLEGRFMSVSVATPKEGGGWAVTCHDSHESVSRARQAKAAAKPAPETAPAREEK